MEVVGEKYESERRMTTRVEGDSWSLGKEKEM